MFLCFWSMLLLDFFNISPYMVVSLQDYKKSKTAFHLICTANFVLRITLHLLKEFATVTSLFTNKKNRLYLTLVIISSVSGILFRGKNVTFTN